MGVVKAYRPSMLMWWSPSGDNRAPSASAASCPLSRSALTAASAYRVFHSTTAFRAGPRAPSWSSWPTPPSPKVVPEGSSDFDEVVHRAMRQAAQDGQRELDRVYRQYAGKPAAQIEPELRRAMAKTAIPLDAAQLRDWSTLISDKTRIQLKA